RRDPPRARLAPRPLGADLARHDRRRDERPHRRRSGRHRHLRREPRAVRPPDRRHAHRQRRLRRRSAGWPARPRYLRRDERGRRRRRAVRRSARTGCVIARPLHLAAALSAMLGAVACPRPVPPPPPGPRSAPPPSTWLLRPLSDRVDRSFRFHVTTPDDVTFASGVFPAQSEPSTFRAGVTDLPASPYSAFGRLRTMRFDVGGRAIDVALAS